MAAHKPPKAELVPTSAPPASPHDEAKRMYMAYASAADISRQTGITTRQLQRWRTEEAWVTERDAAERELIEDGFSSRKLTVSRIATTSVEQLKRGIDHLAKRPDPPSVQEMEKLSVIVSNLDKLSRLDTNRATENIAINAAVKMSVDEIRKAILSDPFSEPPHVDVTSSSG